MNTKSSGKLIPNTTPLPNILIDQIAPALSSSSLRVLLAICRKTYGFHKRSDKISFNLLQKLTGLSRPGVNKGIKGLGPLLKITPGVKHSPTLEGVASYEINLDISTEELVNKLYWLKKFTSKQSASELVNKVNSTKENTKENKTAESDKPIPGSFSSSVSKKKKKPAPDPAQVEAFDRFYQTYPRHVAKERAWRAWQQLDPDPALASDIQTAVKRYTAEVEDTEAKFIAHPATWLNGRRWEDEAASGNDQAPPEVKDLGDGRVEVDGRTMDRQMYERRERRYGKAAR